MREVRERRRRRSACRRRDAGRARATRPPSQPSRHRRRASARAAPADRSLRASCAQPARPRRRRAPRSCRSMPARVPCGACDRLEQIRRAGLAVRPRDAKDAQLCGRIPVKSANRSGRSQSAPIATRTCGTATSSQRSTRHATAPAATASAAKSCPSACCAGDAAEQRARLHDTAVVHDRNEFRRRRHLGPRGGGPQSRTSRRSCSARSS